jgi:hypothetical protein
MTSPSGRRGGTRAGSGKPPFAPTETDRSMVSVLAAVGVKHEEIASVIGPKGIAVKTLRRHFVHELAIGRTKLDGICVSGIAKAMQAGQAWALCFWAKTRMGWRETSTSNHTFEPAGNGLLKELADAIRQSPRTEEEDPGSSQGVK